MDPAQLDPEFSHDLYVYHPPCFFPFCLSSVGELPVATTGYFALSFLAIQLSVFRFKPGGIFLLFY